MYSETSLVMTAIVYLQFRFFVFGVHATILEEKHTQTTKPRTAALPYVHQVVLVNYFD
jgi:hypothetical protein